MSENEPYPDGYLEALGGCTVLAEKLLRKIIVVDEEKGAAQK